MQAALLPAVAAAFPLDSGARKGTTPQEHLLTAAVLGKGSPPGTLRSATLRHPPPPSATLRQALPAHCAVLCVRLQCRCHRLRAHVLDSLTVQRDPETLNPFRLRRPLAITPTSPPIYYDREDVCVGVPMVMTAKNGGLQCRKGLHQSGGCIVWPTSSSFRPTAVSVAALPGAGTALVLAVVVPNVEFIFGLVGSTASVFIAYLLPAILYLSLSGRPALLSQLNPADVATGAPPQPPPPPRGMYWFPTLHRDEAVRVNVNVLVSPASCTKFLWRR